MACQISRLVRVGFFVVGSGFALFSFFFFITALRCIFPFQLNTGAIMSLFISRQTLFIKCLEIMFLELYK